MNNISSPRTDDAGIEPALQKSVAPRVSLAELNANIVHTEIVRHVSQSGQVLRWAVLTTRNGFAVTGRPSAAVCAENDDAKIGEAVAVENARQELWPLMGYELRSHVAALAAARLPTKDQMLRTIADSLGLPLDTDGAEGGAA